MAIYIRKEPYKTSAKLKDVLAVDTVNNLKHALGLMRRRITNSPRKAVMVELMAREILANPKMLLGELTFDETQLVQRVVDAGPNSYVEVNDGLEVQRLQDTYIVISYVVPNSTLLHLYMLDELREALKPVVEEVLDLTSHSVEDFVQEVGKQKENEVAEAIANNTPISFEPAFTNNPTNNPDQVGTYVSKLIRSNQFEVVMKLNESTYFTFYFLREEQQVRAVACWGDVFEFMMKSVSRSWDGYLELSRGFAKKYPVLTKHYTNQRSIDTPYLNTIGFEGQPKQWFLTRSLVGADWGNLAVMGLYEDTRFMEAANQLRNDSLALYKELLNSDAKTPKYVMSHLFGLTGPINDVTKEYKPSGLLERFANLVPKQVKAEHPDMFQENGSHLNSPALVKEESIDTSDIRYKTTAELMKAIRSLSQRRQRDVHGIFYHYMNRLRDNDDLMAPSEELVDRYDEDYTELESAWKDEVPMLLRRVTNSMENIIDEMKYFEPIEFLRLSRELDHESIHAK